MIPLGARSALPTLGLCAIWALACGSQPSPLDASEPLVERNGSSVVLRWSEAPAGESISVYAGPSPDRIDRSSPVAQLVDGRAELSRLSFEGRPFFEISRAGAEPLVVAERLLPFEGAEHFRDLGGYETHDGRRVRWGRAFRSGQLAELSDDDLEGVADLGLRLVVDFRSDKEREAEPDRLPSDPGLRSVLAPITTEGVDPHDIRRGRRNAPGMISA